MVKKNTEHSFSDTLRESREFKHEARLITLIQALLFSYVNGKRLKITSRREWETALDKDIERIRQAEQNKTSVVFYPVPTAGITFSGEELPGLISFFQYARDSFLSQYPAKWSTLNDMLLVTASQLREQKNNPACDRLVTTA